MRLTRHPFAQSLALLCASTALAMSTPAFAAVTKTQLAGNPLTAFPHFEYVKAINQNAPVNVAIDPRFLASAADKTCRVYVVAAKRTVEWDGDTTLTDVRATGFQTFTFNGSTIQTNTHQLAAGSVLAGPDATSTALGKGYDVVLDCNENGVLDGDDFIDGRNNESGFYVVRDTTVAGPYGVTSANYNLSAAVGTTFGIPATQLAENLFYPTNIASLGQLPLVVISHGNGHNYAWYNHLGNHLASYGYIVMSHANNTVPGPDSASTTTLRHTEAFINQVAAGTIAGGALTGHLNADLISWIGHSRGAEGVAIAYDRLFDGTVVPSNYSRSDIRFVSSMLPTDFKGSDAANPHDANYHLWTASGDSDVDGSAGCEICQTYHLVERATKHRQSTSVQGVGHGWFHNGGGNPYLTGPCQITQSNTHKILLGHTLPLLKRYVEDDIPSVDFLTRQYESFRPIGVPTNDSCIVVSHEYHDGSSGGTRVLDNFQSASATSTSSMGGAVTFSVSNLSENKLDDNNADFSWSAADPFNGATQVGNDGPDVLNPGNPPIIRNDNTRGVVFDWNGVDRNYELSVPLAERNFSNSLFLSLRGAQGTQHPNTLANAGDLTFTVTLRDTSGVSSSINSGAYGGGFEKPYARGGGWHNEVETVRFRLTDFQNNNSGIDLANIAAVRFNFGPTWGTAQGRIVLDDIVLSNDRAVYDGADNGDPHIRTVNGIDYDFQAAGEFTMLRGDDTEIQTRQTAVPTAGQIFNGHTGLTSCVSVNTAVAARVNGARVTFQPSITGEVNPEGMELRVDGKRINLNTLQTLALGAGGRVVKAGSGIDIDFPDGGTLRAIPGFWNNMWYLNISVTQTPATEGLMGLIRNGDWLPQMPDGSAFGPRPASLSDRHAVLNEKFADAWRVSKESSLFDYASGQTTEDFTIRGWPKFDASSCDLPSVRPVEPIDKDTAAKACADVAHAEDRANCAIDVATMGDLVFAKTYLETQALDRGATRTELFGDRKGARPGGSGTFTAVVTHLKSGKRVTGKDGESGTGSVQFTLDGRVLGEPIRLDAFGQATRRITRLRDGQRMVGAIFLPDPEDRVLLTSTSDGLPFRVKR